MKKKYNLLFALGLVIFILAGCSKETAKEINVGAMKGPTGMGMIKLMENEDYNFSLVGTADEISTGLIKGDLDIAAVPCNLASVLYNKTEGQIKICGINTLGVLYILETGESINDISDLRGKTIYSTGLGTTPQYTLEHLLKENGIDPEHDLTIEYKTEATEVAAILSEADNAIAMLPQPFATTVIMNNDRARIALDIDIEWKRLGNETDAVVTGVVVAREDFLKNNKKVVEKFFDEYKKSAEFVNTNVEEAANLMEKHDLFKAAVAKKAIPLSNIVFIQGEEMKGLTSNYLNILNNQNPKSIGGQLPAEDFYYIP